MTSPKATIVTPRIVSRLSIAGQLRKTATPKTTPSEGSSFLQTGGRGRGIGKGGKGK
jgi:hypothetical protein